MSSGGWVDEEDLKHWHIEPIFFRAVARILAWCLGLGWVVVVEW